ncbi:MAG: C39 family peptidase [Bacilli bacterium]|nr:C39 family peptidase [Bacilli bacterium]
MKKGLVILFIVIDVVILILYINIHKNYSVLEEKLLLKLNGVGYNEFILDIEKEREKIINNIENTTKYEIDTVDDFKYIKKELISHYDKLLLENKELVNKNENLKKQKTNLKQIYNNILEEEMKKSTYKIDGIPLINQYSMGYPTGCESAAITSLLKYWRISVSMRDIVNVLPKGNLPYYENGIKYGGNPYIEFVGTPTNKNSYGTYEKAIITVANKYKSGIIDGTGMSLNSVLDIVREGRPVVVWVSMNMAVPYISDSWIYKPTGDKINWQANEHALVLIGYNDSQIIVADSLNGQVRYYDRSVFESRYNYFGKRALYY